MADAPAPLLDARDAIEHLRRVHFSLLVAAFALFSLTFAREPGQAEKATEQLAQIRAALERWSPGWITAALEQAASAQPDRLSSPLPGIDCASRCEPDAVVVRPRTPFASGPQAAGLRPRVVRAWTALPLPGALRAQLAPGEYDKPFALLGLALEEVDQRFLTPVPRLFRIRIESADIEAPRSVAAFGALWDALGALPVAYAVEQPPRWVRVDAGDSQDASPYERERPLDGSWPEVELALTPLEPWAVGYWKDRTDDAIEPTHQLVGYTVWGEVWVPVEVSRITVRLREAFHRAHGSAWGTGTFAATFPELSVIAGEPEMTLDEAAALLSAERAKLDSDIAIFGLAIPSRAVSRWGGAIVVLAQFYFWLHLRAFRRTLEATARPTLAPWIGIYPDTLARAATVASALALPPLALTALILGGGATLALGAVIVTSLALGALTYVTLRACWASIDP